MIIEGHTNLFCLLYHALAHLNLGGEGGVCYKRRKPDLRYKVAQGVESNHAKALCDEDVSILVKNLDFLYTKHNYPPHHISNCDETRAWARSGGCVLGHIGSCNFHFIIHDFREWLSYLLCEQFWMAIHVFCVFKGKQI